MKRGALRTSKRILVVLLLLVGEIVFMPRYSQAATAGSGACQQTYTITGTGEVAVYESGGYCFVAFKNTGAADTQAIFSWIRPTQVTSVDALVVGGGGGGGARHGGGGGAGGFVQTDAYAISTATSIAIAVGGGGSASTNFTGTNGQNSYFKPTTASTSGLIAIGGGGGANGTAGNGGSGGGAGAGQTAGSVTSQAQSTFAGVTLSNINFGSAGAAGATDTNDGADLNDYWAGGGGGGASSAGFNPTSNGTLTTAFAVNTSSTARGGAGGNGKSVSWITSTVASSLSVGHTSSSTVYFAGGGGGGIGVDGLSGGAGGLGGGATGTRTDASGNAGTANTGGGGGGSGFDDINKAGSPQTVSAAPAGAGGSGIVVIRFIAPDIVAPTIASIAITSSPGSDNYYGALDNISLTATFSEAVTVTGSPRFPIVGLSSSYLTYASGSGTTSLVFSYQVSRTSLDRDGISIAANSLALNGGTITDAALNTATLTHSEIPAALNLRVDGISPNIQVNSIAADGASLTFTADETLAATSTPTSAFVVTVGSLTDPVTAVTINGTSITLSLSYAILAGKSVGYSYTDPANATSLQDLAGNAVNTHSIAVGNILNYSTVTSNSTISLSLNPVAATAVYKSSTTVKATVSAAGKVDFFLAGKIIVGCRNISTTGSSPITATCIWKPSIHNSVIVTATLKPSSAAITTSSATPLPVFVLKRTNTR